MKLSIALAFFAAVLFVANSTPGGDEPAPKKQFVFHVRFFEGDPLGSQDAGTLQLIAEPHITAVENSPFYFTSDGPIPVIRDDVEEFLQIGRSIEGKARSLKDGKINLNIMLSTIDVVERTEDRIRLHTESTRTIVAVPLGEVVKFRFNEWHSGYASLA